MAVAEQEHRNGGEHVPPAGRDMFASKDVAHVPPGRRDLLIAGVAEACPGDAELPHPRPQGVRIDLQQRGGALAALDPAAGQRQGRLDVPADRVVQRSDRRRGGLCWGGS